MTRELFDFIKAKIASDLPSVYKTVELYRNQDSHQQERDFRTILNPAIFIEFIVLDIKKLALGIKEFDLIIRFRFQYENHTQERLENLDSLDAFRAVMDRFRGDETDTVQFTSLEEETAEFDDNFDMLAMPMIDYRTLFRYVKTYNTRAVGKTESRADLSIKVQQAVYLRTIFSLAVDTGGFGKWSGYSSDIDFIDGQMIFLAPTTGSNPNRDYESHLTKWFGANSGSEVPAGAKTRIEIEVKVDDSNTLFDGFFIAWGDYGMSTPTVLTSIDGIDGKYTKGSGWVKFEWEGDAPTEESYRYFAIGGRNGETTQWVPNGSINRLRVRSFKMYTVKA